LAKQFWFTVHADVLRADEVPCTKEELAKRRVSSIKKEDRDKLQKVIERIGAGEMAREGHSTYREYDIHNISLSECFDCRRIAVWLVDRLVWPMRGEAPLPNPDLPKDIRDDYDEASAILDLSPRGAAALLRLAIQKLCIFLGQKGKNLNKDIGALVKKGLDSKVAKSLDVVRVIGNNAVHPGKVDMKDDRATAEKLFRLLNLIADKMISDPKHVDEFFNSLPEDARKAILERDAKKKTTKQAP
jgi:hypothetical protein